MNYIVALFVLCGASITIMVAFVVYLIHRLRRRKRGTETNTYIERWPEEVVIVSYGGAPIHPSGTNIRHQHVKADPIIEEKLSPLPELGRDFLPPIGSTATDFQIWNDFIQIFPMRHLDEPSQPEKICHAPRTQFDRYS